jgi:uncharacterized protein (TIGR02246 family)
MRMAFAGPIDDRLALRELIERYADAVNRADADAWADTWAEDGVWILPGIADAGIAGRKAILATWRAAMERFAGVVFLAMPGAIEIDGDRAQLRSYTFETYEKDGSVHRDCGRYDDVATRTPDGWRFARRAFRHLRRD